MNGLASTYSYINILSIDVAVGACIMTLFVGNIANLPIPIPVIASLGISVWLIYTVDHLKDANSIQHSSHTKRHQFHQRYYSEIKFVAGLFLLLQIILLFFLPWLILKAGIALTLVVMIYFLVLWLFKLKNTYHKELVVAIIYTSGIFLPIWASTEVQTSKFVLVLYFQIIGLAFSNLLLFSLLEMASDKLDKQPSLALVIGKSQAEKIIFAILLIGIIFSGFQIINSASPFLRNAQIVIMIMNFTLFLILSIKALKKAERFRYLGDSVFYLPLIHLLWQ